MNQYAIREFIRRYTEEIDLMNCVHFAIGHGFHEPANYELYGCKLPFVERAQCIATEELELRQWCARHHNRFATNEIDASAPMGFTFPPPYNFVEHGDIDVIEVWNGGALVEVDTAKHIYEFTVAFDSSKPFGLAISKIVGKVRRHRTELRKREDEGQAAESAFPWCASTTLTNHQTADASPLR